jgi:hypothetical protein
VGIAFLIFLPFWHDALHDVARWLAQQRLSHATRGFRTQHKRNKLTRCNVYHYVGASGISRPEGNGRVGRGYALLFAKKLCYNLR